MTTHTESRCYRVLVVDDEKPQLASIVSVVAAEFGDAEVKTAESPEAAEKLLRGEPMPFDLAIVDVRLVIDAEGLMVVARLHKMMRGCPRIIVFTAYPTWQVVRKAYECGADTFISKLDVDATDQLRRKMRELVERRVEREELARQIESQRAAESALEANRTEWQKRYGGHFILVRNGQVIGDFESGQKTWEELERIPPAERLDIGIIDVRGATE